MYEGFADPYDVIKKGAKELHKAGALMDSVTKLADRWQLGRGPANTGGRCGTDFGTWSPSGCGAVVVASW